METRERDVVVMILITTAFVSFFTTILSSYIRSEYRASLNPLCQRKTHFLTQWLVFYYVYIIIDEHSLDIHIETLFRTGKCQDLSDPFCS